MTKLEQACKVSMINHYRSLSEGFKFVSDNKKIEYLNNAQSFLDGVRDVVVQNQNKESYEFTKFYMDFTFEISGMIKSQEATK